MNKLDTYHIYDHDMDETFQIVANDKFIDWLNDHVGNGRYSFASSFEKLMENYGD